MYVFPAVKLSLISVIAAAVSNDSTAITDIKLSLTAGNTNMLFSLLLSK
jgi:hypothetical protein